ncbi:DUF4145 domain-containing protein [Escherichia coli]|nr:DUF4145 domain-containing protein [Escherichia coli]
MAIMVHDCPRCGSKKITFNIQNGHYVFNRQLNLRETVKVYELYCICRECVRGTIFLAYPKGQQKSFDGIDWRSGFNFNSMGEILGAITPADLKTNPPPEFLPDKINEIFNEGAKCLSVGCYNASATMFRLCLDIATKELLPPEGQEPANRIRRSLGLRLDWLFDSQRLPEAMRELAECVKDDGNDGAHDGLLDKTSADDLEDFTYILLERLYTEKSRLEEAKIRRQKRHENSGS